MQVILTALRVVIANGIFSTVFTHGPHLSGCPNTFEIDVYYYIFTLTLY